MADPQTQERKRRALSSFAILLIILVLLAVATAVMDWMGVEGVAGATLSSVAMAPVRGFADALPVCLFVLILGGFLGIVTETGAFDAGIGALVRKLRGNEIMLIPILMFIFSIGGTTYGMYEESVPFYLFLAATMVAAGFDSMVGAAVVLLGAGCGVLGSTVNPFAVGVAVDALAGVGIEVNQGVIIALGAILWFVTLAISTIFVVRYAKKVKANKGSTILSLQEQEAMEAEWGRAKAEAGAGASGNGLASSGAGAGAGGAAGAGAGGAADAGACAVAGAGADAAADGGAPARMTPRQKRTLIVFAFAFVVMIIGFIPWGSFGVNLFDAPWASLVTDLPLGQWYFEEASTWFLVMSIVAGLVGRLDEGTFVKSFVNGAAEMMSVVLIIALARSITVLMGETGLDLWILEHAADALAGVSSLIFAPLSYALYLVLSILIPSSSGMATVTMPIMGSLASELGFSVETMVSIFAAGNGLINMFGPTSGAIMGGLALARVEYATWLKFALKLMVVLGVVSVVILTIAMMVLSG